MDLGFDSDDMDSGSDSGSPTSSPTGSPSSKNKSSGELDTVKAMLEVEQAGLKAAKDELVESENKSRALQRKFDQLKSSTSGQVRGPAAASERAAGAARAPAQSPHSPQHSCSHPAAVNVGCVRRWRSCARSSRSSTRTNSTRWRRS